MKINFLFAALVILFSSLIFSQEKTLVGNGEINHGGFGAPVVKYTQIYGEPAVLVGGRGGWIIDHSFVIGGGGYGLANEINSDFNPLQFPTYIHFGYGGLELEYIIASDQIFHFTFYSLIGGGGINLTHDFDEDWDDDDYGTDGFFIFEPAANIELNITSFFRINAGTSYRVISGINHFDFSNSDFDGFSAVFALKFGKF
jgi:hypothetical protein